MTGAEKLDNFSIIIFISTINGFSVDKTSVLAYEVRSTVDSLFSFPHDLLFCVRFFQFKGISSFGSSRPVSDLNELNCCPIIRELEVIVADFFFSHFFY